MSDDQRPVVEVRVGMAADFAAKAHAGQFRKGEPPRPYITHPQEVAALLKRAGVEDPVTLSAAWLHDVMEDCDVPYETLEAHFGAEVAGVVRELTDDPSLGKNAAKEAQLQKARKPEHAGGYSTRARLVKLADKLANLTDIYKHPPGWRGSRCAATPTARARSQRHVAEVLSSPRGHRFYCAFRPSTR